MYGQTIVSSGFIEITVATFGGNDRCSVESIVFTSVAKASGASTSTSAYITDILRSLPAAVPLMSGFEYEVFAVGMCSSGAMTEPSNVLTIQSSSPAFIPSKDPFATLFYPFQGTGSVVQNFAANPPSGASTATIFGTQRQASNGRCVGSLVGSGGVSDVNYVDTKWNLALENQWTLSFRLENVPAVSPFSAAYFVGEESTSFRLFTGGMANSGGLVLRCDACNDVLIVGGATPAPTMVTFVYDSVAGDVKAYLNGALVRTVSQSSSLALVGSDILKVGGMGTSSAMPNGALLSDFRLYADKALTASEVASLYSARC